MLLQTGHADDDHRVRLFIPPIQMIHFADFFPKFDLLNAVGNVKFMYNRQNTLKIETVFGQCARLDKRSID